MGEKVGEAQSKWTGADVSGEAILSPGNQVRNIRLTNMYHKS